MKIRVALLFGGKSVEHEVSVISGIQALKNLDVEKYEITPVYITKTDEMYVGKDIGNIESYRDIKTLLKKSERVIFVNDEGNVKLVRYKKGKTCAGKAITVDIVLPVVHGTNVEDGTLQGYLKTMGVPFAGCDVTASAIGMDKYIQKMILKNEDIPLLNAKVYRLSDQERIAETIADIEKTFGYPVIVKPANLGSSVGISVASDRKELERSIDEAFAYATKILVEHAVSNLREINCAVLGDENDAIASEIEEPLHTKEILSYEDKYVGHDTKNGMSAKSGMGAKNGGGAKCASAGMAGVSRKLPAEVPEKLRTEIRDMAVRAFKALGCNGVARLDFILDEDNNKIYFNEINTIPGSLAFYLFEAIGIKYSELLDRIISLAFARKRTENAITYAFDTNILNGMVCKGAKGAKTTK